MKERRLVAASGLVAFALGIACGGSNIAVARYPHPDFAPAEPVGFLPPPAQIEQIESTPPAAGCLWADGQWLWAAQRWDWRPGAWIRPPDDCRYSGPTAEWAPSGRAGVLYYRPGRWYSVTEPRICPDPVPCARPQTLPTSIPPDS